MCLHGAHPNVPSRVSPVDWTIRCTPYLRDAAHTGSGMCVTGMFGVYSQRTLKHFHMLVGRDGSLLFFVGCCFDGLSEME